MVAQGDGEGDAAVCDGLQNQPGRLFGRRAEDYIAGMYHEIGLLCIQDGVQVLQGALRTGIPGNHVGVGNLEYLELPVSVVFEFRGYAGRLLLAHCRSRDEQRQQQQPNSFHTEEVLKRT